MQSHADSLMRRFGGPQFSRVLGEFDADNESVITYERPGTDLDPIKLVASLQNHRFIEELQADTGETILRERSEAKFEAKYLQVHGIADLEFDALVETPSGKWHVDPETTVWGGAMVTLGLVRKPLARKQESRYAGV